MFEDSEGRVTSSNSIPVVQLYMMYTLHHAMKFVIPTFENIQ